MARAKSGSDPGEHFPYAALTGNFLFGLPTMITVVAEQALHAAVVSQSSGAVVTDRTLARFVAILNALC